MVARCLHCGPQSRAKNRAGAISITARLRPRSSCTFYQTETEEEVFVRSWKQSSVSCIHAFGRRKCCQVHFLGALRSEVLHRSGVYDGGCLSRTAVFGSHTDHILVQDGISAESGMHQSGRDTKPLVREGARIPTAECHSSLARDRGTDCIQVL